MKKTKEILIEKGIKPSIQRIQIFKCLMDNSDHPTAKDIYERISEKIPTLSKTTVYNSVKLFAEKGILNPMKAIEGEIRYDINADFHPHFRCKECGNIYDIDSKIVFEEKKEIDGHLIEEQHISYSGICKKCREKLNI
jgi:Fur family peroxide stress response transcriptional regulator